MHLEKRSGDPRDRCAFSAAVVTVEGEAGAHCTVTDISAGGARIEFDPSLPLPKKFLLALPLVDDFHDTRAVELRWRKGRFAGLRFQTQ